MGFDSAGINVKVKKRVHTGDQNMENLKWGDGGGEMNTRPRAGEPTAFQGSRQEVKNKDLS